MPRLPQKPVMIFRLRLVRNLAIIIFLLTTAHLFTEWARTRMGITGGMGLIELFGLQKEANLPTAFSSFQLLLACGLFFWISNFLRQRGDRRAGQWQGLSLVFLYLAADESAKLHELWIMPVCHLIGDHSTGVFYSPWVIAGMVAVMVVAVIYFRWFLMLDPATRRIFVVAGLLFVGGAIGVEMIDARYIEVHGTDNYTYSILVWIEETCEMSGILVLIHGLLAHIEKLGAPLSLTIRSSRAGGQTPAGDSALTADQEA